MAVEAKRAVGWSVQRHLSRCCA